jgi:hypothetical protein
MPELKQFGRAGKHWISSISPTPLHYLAIDHDVGRWGIYFDCFEIPAGGFPLNPAFPYLLQPHKIGLDLISGKGVNLKQAHHISSAECLIFVVFLQIWCPEEIVI